MITGSAASFHISCWWSQDQQLVIISLIWSSWSHRICWWSQDQYLVIIRSADLFCCQAGRVPGGAPPPFRTPVPVPWLTRVVRSLYRRLLPGKPDYFQVNLNTSRYTWLLSGTPDYCQVHLTTSRYTWLLPGTPDCFQVHLTTSRYTWLLPGKSAYFKKHLIISRYFWLFLGTHPYTLHLDMLTISRYCRLLLVTAF